MHATLSPSWKKSLLLVFVCSNRKSRLRTVVWISVLVCTTLACWSTPMMAQPGQLDASFGTGGVFATNTTQQFQFVARAVALQSDGKIVVAGAMNGTGLLRLTTNGSLDPAFGNGGIANITLPVALAGSGDLAVGVAIQRDGKIVVAISNKDTDALVVIIVARVNADGSLDTSFGVGGFGVSSPENTGTDFSNVLALQPDEKILVGSEHFMVRFGTDGRLDSTFGTGGVTVVKHFAGAMAVQSNGQILVATGLTAPPSVASEVFGAPGRFARASLISRYNADGSLDSSFGIFGQAAIVAEAPGVVVQNDGKIVMAGSMADALLPPPPSGITTGFGLVRYNPDGSIDTSFGSHGGVVNSFGSVAPFASANALVQQADGRLIVAGAAGGENSSNFALARYTNDGQLDGQVITGIANNLSVIVALGLQNDGKIVAVGNFGAPAPSGRFVNNIAVARYLGQ
jgi:uncharacterized delta-60 repeat protein